MKIAAIVTGQSDSQAGKTWAPAAIHGTQTRSNWLIFSRSETAYVSAIDGRPVPHETETWSKDLELRPGRHWISGLSSDGELGAEVVLICDARPAAKYELRSETDSKQEVKLWIEDLATGQPATRVATVATKRTN